MLTVVRQQLGEALFRRVSKPRRTGDAYPHP